MKPALLATVALICCLSASPARAAALQTYDVEWSGAPLGNSARASGLITLNLAVLPNPGGCTGPCMSIRPFIQSLTITVTGADAGNGTFGIPDFAMLSWSTGGATLDLTQQLVGQPTTIDPWGTPCAAAQQPMCADFNLYSRFFITGSGNPFAPTAAATPTLIAPFILDTDGGAPPGDRMFLMSFAPVNDPASVPVPIVGAGLPGLISVGGLLGWWLGRQKKPPKLLSKSQRRIAVNATIAKRTPRRKGSTFISE
jgi:hypothetical protein